LRLAGGDVRLHALCDLRHRELAVMAVRGLEDRRATLLAITAWWR